MPPRHQIVARLIQRGIANGDLPAGQELPSARDLTQRYGIAPNEVRLVIAHLHNSGFVQIDDGRTVVSDPPAQSLIASASTNGDKAQRTSQRLFTESAALAGLTARYSMTTSDRHASAEVADRLEVEIGQGVVERRSLGLVDQVPTMLEVTYFPHDLVGRAANLEQIKDDYLHGLGWRRVGSRDEVTARNPLKAEQRLLRIDATAPVIDHHQVHYAVREGSTRVVSYKHRVLVGVRNRLVYESKQADLPQISPRHIADDTLR